MKATPLRQAAMKLVACLSAAVAMLAAPLAPAQTFNAETRVSSVAGPSIHPNVIAVGDNVYVVWVENFLDAGTYKGDIYFSRSTNGGASFEAPVNLTAGTPARNDQLPIIAAGGTQVHIFWTDNVATGDVYHRRSTDSGASFFAEVKRTTTDAFYSRPTGALVDSGGRVHLAYYDDKPPANAYGQIYYQCSSDSGANFTAATNITQFDGVVDNEAPRLAQGTDGTLYVVFRSSRAGVPFGGYPPFEQYLMRTSAPVSSCSPTWLRPAQKITPGQPEQWANTFGASIAPGANNVLHAAYWSDKAGTNLVYRRGYANGKGWETPSDISLLGRDHLQWDGTVPEHTGFGLAEDAAGKLHAAFGENNHLTEGFQSGPLYYRCSNDGGTSWVARTLVTGQANTAQPRAAYANNRFHIVWMDWRDNNTGAEIYYRSVTTGACAASSSAVSVSASALAFGGQSMGTTSPPQAVTVTNVGSGALAITLSASTQFGQSNNCGASLAAGASCTVNVSFTPTAAAGAVGSTSAVSGSLTITAGSGSPSLVSLSGTAEKSLVTHYYRSILRRAPDAGGKSFWESEALRMQSLGANVNETWYSMASFFYFSPEYIAFGRDNAGFVTDLYNTFFNRGPDGPGLSFWTGQLGSGMPREVVLVSFMFSAEFSGFTQGIFGNTAARAEVDTVLDFYRGMLARLPDTGGLNAWVQNFRTAQCQGAGAVYSTVEAISSAFATSGEYAARGRTNAQYIGDIYNSFLRRGGDLGGVQFWIGQLDSGAKSRETVRRDFIASAEFTNRVNAIIAQGCLP